MYRGLQGFMRDCGFCCKMVWNLWQSCARGLEKLGFQVFFGPHQSGTVSFLPGMDCEEAAAFLARQKIAVRAGLHCAPLAHESAGTIDTGTVRVSFGMDADPVQVETFLRAASKLRAADF